MNPHVIFLSGERMLMNRNISFFFTLSLAVVAVAGVMVVSDVCRAEEYPYIYRGLRPMGMGGAFTAVSDDAHALFYNPAGLALIKESEISFFPLEVEIAEKTLGLYTDAMDTDFDSEEETAEFLRDHMGERARFGLSLFPHYARPRFALGIIATLRLDSEVHDRQYPKMALNGVSDVGAGVGYAHPLLENRLLVGASAKLIRRTSLIEEYSAIDIASKNFDDTLKDDMKEGMGLLIDLGAIYCLDDLLTKGLRAGICLNNLVGQSLQDAQDVKAHTDIGIAYERDLGIVRATFAADYVDIFSQYAQDSDPAKRIRLGAEVRFPTVLSLRAGLYQGYPTFGATIDAWILRIDALTYAEELGAYAGQRECRRYAANVRLGF